MYVYALHVPFFLRVCLPCTSSYLEQVALEAEALDVVADGLPAQVHKRAPQPGPHKPFSGLLNRQRLLEPRGRHVITDGSNLILQQGQDRPRSVSKLSSGMEDAVRGVMARQWQHDRW